MNLVTGTKTVVSENDLNKTGLFSMQMESKRWLRSHRGFLICAIVIWIFFAWLAANTPYGLDDWRWGIPGGFEDFITGSQNGRYIGNLFEIIVTRSVLLKVILIATMAALLPLLSVSLIYSMVGQAENEVDEQKVLIGMLLAATLMYLAVPREVWRQTFGWIAGFSNFGFSGVLLLIYQKYLFAAQKTERTAPVRDLTGTFLAAFFAALILENITVYITVVSLFSMLFFVVRNRRINARHLALLLGCLAGAVMMFSGSIYGTLFSTGQAWNDMRSLTIDLNAGLLDNLRILYMRFVYFFPHEIWGDQWVPCMLTALLLAMKGARSSQKGVRLLSAAFILFAIYFIAVRFFGPIENYVARWSDVLTQRLNLLFFWMVLLMIIACWRDRRNRRNLLIFLWISVPGIIAPLLVTNTTGQSARCILTPTVVLIEFCMVLIADGIPFQSFSIRRILGALLSVMLLVSAGEKLIVSYANGQLMRERAALVRSAQEGEKDVLEFPDFPYLEYLWVTEPLGDRQIGFFREFYRIPENVRICFNTGNLEDYDFYEHIRS